MVCRPLAGARSYANQAEAGFGVSDPMRMNRLASILALLLSLPAVRAAETVAFFPFDEPVGLYPSSVISDHSAARIPLIIGPGGSIVPGKFGHAFSTAAQPPVDYPAGSVLFGLTPAPIPAGRTVEPLNWHNARFAALLTAGEKHLRKEIAAPNPTATGLNLGAFDWTVEFWYRGAAAPAGSTDAVVFELGEGPRAENDHVTALLLASDRSGFVFVNQPGGTRATIASDRAALTTATRWAHFAFVHDAARGVITHYVDGRPVGAPVTVKVQALPAGAEAYFSLGRDARWERALPGAMDELRVSRGAVYAAAFTPPGSLVANPTAGAPAIPARISEPLRFAEKKNAAPVQLGGSKHLLLDDALFPEHTNVSFVPTPPLRVEMVLELQSPMRKHVVVLDDGQGLIRLYAPLANDLLGVLTSKDGLHFDEPRLTTGTDKSPNIVMPEDAGTPSVFIDPLAPPAERWKLVSGWGDRGIFVFTSPDGYAWTLVPTAAISARSASQSNLFYDDQRGQYLGYHRTDIARTAYGRTERRFVMTAVDSLQPPWPFTPLVQADYDRVAEAMRLPKERPWYLDNGPLTPGGIGIEWPTVFQPVDGFDPTATDIYVPKAVKYPWAPDAYLAFPPIYFHYEGTRPETRAALGEKDHGRGSGPIETQLMASRDGVNWTHYPRPVWLGIGEQAGFDVHQTYMAHGMIRRGEEVWMYTFNSNVYHSGAKGKKERRAIFRTVQRVDRFVAAEAPYEREATLVSRPLVFAGQQLILNIDTHASGWAQIGLRHADGSAIEGFGVDECVYVNGNELHYPVEWLGGRKDVSALAGQTVQIVVRMRGASLFSMQFTP